MNYPLVIQIDQSSDEDEYEDEKGPITFGPDINNDNNKNREVKELGKYDKKYHHRVVYPGLNFQGRCRNSDCAVKGQMVWVGLGYGAMSYEEMVFNCPCPICKVLLDRDDIENIGYHYAKVKFTGRKENDKKNLVEFCDEEKKGKLIKFTGGQSRVGWYYLKMQIDKL